MNTIGLSIGAVYPLNTPVAALECLTHRTKMMNDDGWLRLVDSETPGGRCDVRPLFGDYAAFATLVEDLAARFADTPVGVVAGIAAFHIRLFSEQAGKGLKPLVLCPRQLF